MNKTLVALTVVAMLVGLAVVATTVVAAEDAPKAAAAGQGPGAGMARGYIKVTPESTKIWQDLRGLMLERHRTMWELFRLRSEEKVDEEAVKAQAEKLQKIMTQSQEARKALSEYCEGGPEGQGMRQGRRGQMGRGMRGGMVGQGMRGRMGKGGQMGMGGGMMGQGMRGGMMRPGMQGGMGQRMRGRWGGPDDAKPAEAPAK